MACPDPNNPEEVEAMFPDGTTPENRIQQPSALCSYYGRRHQITGMFRQLLMQHFVDPNNMAEFMLRTKLTDSGAWRPSETTGLLIESHSKWTPSLTGKRPAILIKPNIWNWQQMTRGNYADDVDETGAQRYIGAYAGSHTFIIIADKAVEAEILAAEVENILCGYIEEILRFMHLQRFTPVQIGEPAPIKESTTNWGVPVTFAYVIEKYWEVLQHAPRLKRIVFYPNGDVA